MSAGVYVGRVGSLAVALGIGAAVLATAGLASADGDASPKSPGASSTSQNSDATGTTKDKVKRKPPHDRGRGQSGRNTDSSDGTKDANGDSPTTRGGGGKPATAPSKDTGPAGTPATGAPGGSNTGTTNDTAGPGKDTEAPGSTTPVSGSTGATDTTTTGDAKDDAPTIRTGKRSRANDVRTGVDRTAQRTAALAPASDAITTRTKPTEPQSITTVSDPIATIAQALSTIKDPFTPAANSPGADVGRATPLLAPATTFIASVADDVLHRAPRDLGAPARELTSLVMSLVAAGRNSETDSTTSSAAVKAAVATEAAATEPPFPIPLGANVTVEKVNPPLQFLQEIPVVGQTIVTPIVAVIHQIPLVSELLHPIIGFPIDWDAPPGAPQPATYKVTSFDGTSIYVNVMPAIGLKAGQTAPTILDGPGLGLPGSTTLDLVNDELLPTDVIGVGKLRQAGYNVVTWDPRGEWHSGGVLHIDSPQLEGRDVSSIISFLSTLPEVQLDEANDPRIGMVGASYGGGIQLSAAGIDPRIDAIVPTIAWNNLVDVLFPHGAVNSVWGTLLPGVLAITSHALPRIYPVAIQGVLFGIAEQQDIDLVNSYGFADNIKNITAPTLLIQGTVDTLFPLYQADLNYDALTSAKAVKVIWYCGGHGACLSSTNTGQVNIDRTLDWLDRYVKGDEKVNTGPKFEYVDQNGQYWASDTYPVKTDDTPMTATRTSAQTLLWLPFVGGAGPDPRILSKGPIQTLLGIAASGPAVNAVDLQVAPVAETTQIVGSPEISFTYSGTGTAKHVYAQIVDNQTNLVLGTISTPIPVTLDGETHQVKDFAMNQVAETLYPGQSVRVQLVTSANQFFNLYSWGGVTIDSMSIKLPTVAAGAATPVVATTSV